MAQNKPRIGFIGQGYVGKSYADAIERLGHQVVRYSLEEPYRRNKAAISGCDIVFIAVPTPTTHRGFDGSIVEEALSLLKKGSTAVIKSTIIPGTTRMFQKKFPQLFIMHSPEFLVARSAAHDAVHPTRSIVGIAKNTPEYRKRAKTALAILPRAPFEKIVSAEEAELIKYGGNFFLYLKVVFGNLMYEASESLGADYDIVREVIGTDPRIGASHLQVAHDSGHRGARTGRGAGGICFVKDIEAFRKFYASRAKDILGAKLIDAVIAKNIALLVASKKDFDLVASTYPKYAQKRSRT